MACGAVLGSLSTIAHAQPAAPQPAPTTSDPSPTETEVVVVEDEAPYIPVASRSARDRDFKLRPHPRPADILRVVPGLFVNQHAGGGKANQYFLRGFDADHGTDIALSVDGIPANMVSHGHGQGYTDLNWVIPEVIRTVNTFKGPYAATLGDFATAGAVDMQPHDALPASSLSVTAGVFDTYRAVGIWQGQQRKRWQPLAALELFRSDGPFTNGENNRRYSLHTQAFRQVGETTTIKLAATSYAAAWNGSGQLPLRDVRAGQIGRFDAIDPSEGGVSQRHSAYAKLQSYQGTTGDLSALVYLVRYKLNLFSNFTFFSADSVNGDQIEQLDDRWYTGFSARYRRRDYLGPLRLMTSVGVQGRGDMVATGLYNAVERQRSATQIDADVRQGSLGAYLQEDITWTPWLRSVTGLRVDGFGFAVSDNVVMNPRQKTVSAVRASPKASLVLSPTRDVDIYANAALGFHSNDARALVRDTNPGTALTQAAGYELGFRSRIAKRVDLAGSAWVLDLDQETVWVGDEGVTEARGPTRRLGIEVEARARLLDWLTIDSDITIARSRFRDLPGGEDAIPLAPRFTFTGGVSVYQAQGVFGRFGARSLSDRPLTEDGFLTAQGFTLFDLTVGYRTRSYEVTLGLDNLLNATWREAQFATTSRLPHEPSNSAPPPAMACPAETRSQVDETGNFAGCEDVHFTPGAPFNAMLTLRLFLD